MGAWSGGVQYLCHGCAYMVKYDNINSVRFMIQRRGMPQEWHTSTKL